MSNEREKLSSRLGFILLSAGCAIGIGNLYKFPLTTGYYGGGFFVLFYLIFLLILGLPLMSMELAVGRASRRSIAQSFDELEKPKQKWHIWKYGGMFGNYALMSCYTIIVAWIGIYFVKYLTGSIMPLKTTESLNELFGGIITNPGLNILAAFIIIILGFGVCAIGLKNGVEKVTKGLMIVLLVILMGMVIYSLTLDGAKEGLKFYLIPSVERLKEAGVINTITAAMTQAFFTLGLGIGSIAIFGSYIEKDRSLVNESIIIIVLDTFVALMSGFIIFPACFTFSDGVHVDGNVSASFVFTTFASIFNSMGPVTGRILGTLFFMLLLFAALSTVIAVFENIISFWIDLSKIKRPLAALINVGIICLFALITIFGNTILSNIHIFKYSIMDFEDFFVSFILLPIGCLVYCLFCTQKAGWGYDNYINEVNEGNGIKLPKRLKYYLMYVLPLAIVILFVLGLIR